ncbi:hypothetical protein O6H91_13G086100 [Diphasiastrum complanatum]|nr:hypothetical protein O6H91_13G086100 [Diphasiastrum complanatum]
MASSKKKKDVWVKEKDLDSVLQTEKKMKELMEMVNLLEQQEEHIMSLFDLKNFWRCVGSKGMRRFRFLVKKYPGIFRYTVDHEKEPWVDLTEDVEQLLRDEKIAKQENKPLLVEKMRKLLMMSVDRRLRVEKLCHLKYMFGFPDEFRKKFLNEYPEFFHVVETSIGPCLELKTWDPALAITAREKAAWEKLVGSKTAPDNTDFQMLSHMSRDSHAPNYEFEMFHPKGGTPGRREFERIARFQALPFPSPYEDAVSLDPASPEAEKRTVGVVHELLSLTIDKKSVISRISFFKNEFNIPNCSEALFERYPGIFYVSHSGDHHVVFLKEAYKGSEVLEKSPLLLINEHLVRLMKLGRAHKRHQNTHVEDEESHGSSDELSEIEQHESLTKTGDIMI